MSPEPIVQLCTDPARTRERADLGLQTPCYRCMAYRPDTRSGCHFLETGAEIAPLPRSPEEPDQLPLFRTPDTMEVDT